ncbi:Phospholipid scramblase 2 [Trichoplax sp. H2]|nr:Phospholipid scramblase 2 [Trichoplax sp. H2]|eukprot:RDD36442.1 Phospholipid scramblase 2 [Trichoplax sp. H2]
MDEKLLDSSEETQVTIKSSRPNQQSINSNELIIIEQPSEQQNYGTSEELQNIQWMQPPQVCQPDAPPGLEYLTQIDQLLIHQVIEIFEAVTGFQTRKRFFVKNSMGQQVLFASERNGCLTMQCCGSIRPFEINLTDNMKRDIIHLSRPMRLGCRCFPCCLQELEVQAPPGETIGYVRQIQTFVKREFNILNTFRDPVLKIRGPCWLCSCLTDIDFDILTSDGETVIGKITKQWPGLWRETFTLADNFGIRFPVDLDVKIKATLLGAVFLMDFMYFEGNNRRRRRY